MKGDAKIIFYEGLGLRKDIQDLTVADSNDETGADAMYDRGVFSDLGIPFIAVFKYGRFEEELPMGKVLNGYLQTAKDIAIRMAGRIETVRSWVTRCENQICALAGTTYEV